MWKTQRRVFISFSVLIILAAIVSFVAIRLLDEWTDDIIEGKKVLTEVVVEKLAGAAQDALDSLNRQGYFATDSLPKNKIDQLDQRLKRITSAELSHLPGIEGGFYLPHLNEFYGYGFPTSPPPVPVFGPPPRSYKIIQNQVLQSISSDSLIVNVHRFDPAIFPLATKSITLKNGAKAGVWARIHIERELPSRKYTQVYQFVALLFAAGFIVLVIIVFRQRKNINLIKKGLKELQENSDYRFPGMGGVFSFVSTSINKLIDDLTETHKKNQYLEQELHQRDKMASLGNLIAGVAHEVKTPLAIIKTRIQMWQRSLKNGNTKGGEIISDDSMQLVIREIDRLTRLVKRLLVFSKPLTGTLKPLQINKLIQQTLELIIVETDSRITFTTHLDEHLPSYPCDANAMEQVFINLISNSIEAIQYEGTITLKTAWRGNEQVIRITVSDSGPGIPKEIEGKIFDPFFTTKTSGAGLGLSIAYEVIKAHGGKIYFLPSDSSGSVCVIDLPVEHGK
ncbi:MAG: hypothetical protein HRU80_08085 [Ignavibacteriales bacterium]|nr:MAG: hypothetical protein HRU80_08085 [Ignavibacteriales bacterium]